MAKKYKIFGSEISPYSIKVRSWFRYKGIPFTWKILNYENNAEFKKYAKIPLIPLVVSPDRTEALQDSTKIIQYLEKRFPSPSTSPSNQDIGFLSLLLEEYADEWLNKPMFHYRWNYKNDEQQTSKIISDHIIPKKIQNIPIIGNLSKSLIQGPVSKRMKSRFHFVGISKNNSKTIEESFVNIIHLLTNHLSTRPYIFGKRPSLADFAIWGQIYNLWHDPTPKKFIENEYSDLINWIDRMIDPKTEGKFESLDSLMPTLMPILKEEIGELFLPWAKANSSAVKKNENNFTIKLKGREFTQKSQKFQAKTFSTLRDCYQKASTHSELNHLLQESNCLKHLR
jgi:glutathione S-transferase